MQQRNTLIDELVNSTLELSASDFELFYERLHVELFQNKNVSKISFRMVEASLCVEHARFASRSGASPMDLSMVHHWLSNQIVKN
jgi:hypothetical protein